MSRVRSRVLATLATLGILVGGVMLQSLPADREAGAYTAVAEQVLADPRPSVNDAEDRDTLSSEGASRIAVREVPVVATPPPPPPPEPAPAPAPAPAPPGDRAAMLALLNGARGGGLSTTGALNALAQYRAQDMIDRDYFSHVPLEGLLAQFGVPWTAWGENIGWRAPSGSMQDFHAMFMASPGHRANILNPGYHHVGIGIAAGRGKVILVEVFTD